MARKKAEKVQFRYCEMPTDSSIMELSGEKWAGLYGREGVLHYHNCLEVGYCCSGEGSLILNKEEIPYFPETFTVIPANQIHNMVSSGEKSSVWELLYIDVERFLSDMYPGRSRFVEELSKRINQETGFFTYEGYPVPGGLILEMFREMQEKNIFYQESVKGYLLAFLLEIARMKTGRQKNRETKKEAFLNSVTLKEENTQIEKALAYVAGHYSEQIRVKDLADACGLSETHFRRVFRKNMNLSPSDYVCKVRIRKASELLNSSSCSLEEIAMKTGFISMSTFNRNFRKLLGTSPHSWRREKNA